MNKVAFWSEWTRNSRLSFLVISGIALLLIASVLVFQLGGLSYFYTWEMTGYLQNIPIPVFSDHTDFIESQIHTNATLIFQQVSGGYRTLPEWVVLSFMTVIYLAIVGMLTLSTYLSRLWFVIAAGFFILLIALAGFARVSLFGLDPKFGLWVVTLPMVGLSYYFHAIRANTVLWFRFISFLGCLVLFVTLAITDTSSDHKLLELAYNAYLPAIVLSIVFTMIIGHEIVHGILVLTTYGSKQNEKGNAIHFIVFSVIYLLNVGLVYLKNYGYLHWEIYYIDVYLLLTVSTIIGLWGLKEREVLYGNILPFYPFAVYLYLILVLITYATLGFVLLSGNDSAVEVFEDAIVYGHLSFGSSYLLYLIANFIHLLVKNLPVHRIAYREDNFPYVTNRIAGVIGVAAFFFLSNQAALSQAMSGYFNGLGDMYLMTNKTEKAIDYYTRGSIFGNNLSQSNKNNKSNYMLGELATDPKLAIKHYQNSVGRIPTAHAYASLGSAFESDNQFFEAIFAYQKGLSLFPNNWALQNNLALLYNRTDVLDSTLFYLNSIDESDWKQAVVNANKVGVSTMKGVSLDTKKYIEEDRISNTNNLMVYALMNNEDIKPSILEQEAKALHLFSFSYLNNLGLYTMRPGDETYLRTIDDYLNEPRNGDYHRTLSFIKGLNLYKNGHMTEAFSWMNSMRSNHEQIEGQLCAVLGKWSMELGQPYLARQYFELSHEVNYPMIVADLAHSYAASNNASVAQYLLNKAFIEMDSLGQHEPAHLKKLEQAIEAGRVTWASNRYEFELERKQLEELTKNKSTDGLRSLALRNPFFIEGVLRAVEALNASNNKDKAYEVLQNAISVNEYAVPIVKTYIDQCFDLGYVNYAESTILKLYEVLPIEEYQAYEMEFDEKKSLAIAKATEW